MKLTFHFYWQALTCSFVRVIAGQIPDNICPHILRSGCLLSDKNLLKRPITISFLDLRSDVPQLFASLAFWALRKGYWSDFAG